MIDWKLIDWGNVPAFIAATLTGLSLIIAAITYRRSQRNSEREQASMVAGWIDIAPDPASDPESGVILGYIVRIRNASKMPIYGVSVEGPERNLGRLSYSVIRPKDTLPPDSETMPNITIAEGWRYTRISKLKQDPLALPRFTFYDAAGRMWRRDELGKLIQQTRTSRWSNRWRWRTSYKRKSSDNIKLLANDPGTCDCGHSDHDHYETEDSYSRKCKTCDCEYFLGLPPETDAHRA
jgi:hypothetical protein